MSVIYRAFTGFAALAAAAASSSMDSASFAAAGGRLAGERDGCGCGCEVCPAESGASLVGITISGGAEAREEEAVELAVSE